MRQNGDGDSRPARDTQINRLMHDINRLSDEVRKLRAGGNAAAHDIQVQAAEEQLRGKWQELRTLRAGAPDQLPPRPRGRYG